MANRSLLLLFSLALSRANLLDTCDREPACTCRRSCQPSPASCFGVVLPKGQVAARPLLTAPRLNTTAYLSAWRAVIGHVPQCWPRLQALLCTVAWPQCIDNVTVLRPAQEMCLHTLKACSILTELFQEMELPRFLRCANYLRQDNCSSERDHSTSRATLNYHKFENANTSCRDPLVKTSYKKNWFRGIEGCGFRCQPPHFAPDEFRSARFVIPGMALCCFLVNCFVCGTFLLEWRSWSRYPRIIVFYIHGCFLFGCLGWLAQCVPSLYTDIVCRKDGSLRRAEPQLNSGESVTCSLVFAVIYFTLLAVGSWFVLLLAAICPKLQAAAEPEEGGSDGGSGRRSWRQRKQRAPSRLVCHLLAWILPSVFTIICLTVGEIDGDPLAGICFVGHFNFGARLGLLLAPLSASGLAALALLARVLRLQWILLARAREHRRPAAVCEGGVVPVPLLRQSRRSTGIFTLGVGVIFFYAVGIQIYLVMNQAEWDLDFRRQIICKMRHQLEVSGAVSTLHTPLMPSGGSCESLERPSASLLLLHVAAYFGTNLLLSSLAFDRRVLSTWRRCVSRVSAWFRYRITGTYVSSPRSDTSLEPSSHSLMSPAEPSEASGFSWWDLGFFPARDTSHRGQDAGTEAAAGGPDSEGSELISSSRFDIGKQQHAGLMFHGPPPKVVGHQELSYGHRRSESLSSARTTPNEDGGLPAKRSHRSRAAERRSRRPSQRRHERGDVRRSLSDCSSASSAAVQWRGSWGSVQSYNSYNPQRGVLEERYANWRVQAALNWTSSMAPFYSNTGLPLNFAWQTPVAFTAAPHPASPGAALWACPHAALWPVYMLGPAPNLAPTGGGKPPPPAPQTQQTSTPHASVPAPPQPRSPIGPQRPQPADSVEDSDAFDSEEEVESMNSDAFDSEEEVMSGSDSELVEGEEEDGEERREGDEGEGMKSMKREYTANQ